jgi:hypothetical protein
MLDFAKHLWDLMWSSPEGRLSIGAILALILFRELSNLAKKIPEDTGGRGGEWLGRAIYAIGRAIFKLRRERV